MLGSDAPPSASSSCAPHDPARPPDRARGRDHARGHLDRAARARVGGDRALPGARARPARRLDPAPRQARRGPRSGSPTCILLVVIVAVGATFCRSSIDEVNGFVAGAAGLRARPHPRARPARLPRDEVPRRRAGARAGEEGRRDEAPRSLGRGALGDEERDHDRRRDGHDRLPHVLHAARGRDWVERSTRCFPSSRSRGGARSATTSTDGRRLRDRQHPDQPDRRPSTRSCC